MFLEAVGDRDWWACYLQGRPSIHCRFTFQKQSSLSQYRIIGPNGQLLLSVPTERATRKGDIRQVAVSYAEEWQGQHWKGIRSAYASSPFFPYYEHLILPLYTTRFERLWDFQLAYFRQICRALRVQDQLILDDQSVDFLEREMVEMPAYPQVFEDRHGFVQDLCLLDMLFNLGPETLDLLMDQSSM